MKKLIYCFLVVTLMLLFPGCSGSKCTSILLNTNAVTMGYYGETRGLTVTKIPADSTEKVSFRSSNSSVAVVDEYGLITAVSMGNATITVTCGDAVAFCEVAVGSGDGQQTVGNPSDDHNTQQQEKPTQNTQPQGPMTVSCTDCVGSGSTICRYCDGAYNCNDCGGTGVDPNADPSCTVCGGDGICSACGGDGKKSSGRRCSPCEGTGDCSYCKGTGDKRYAKYGAPSIMCSSCAGFGVCKECDNGFVACKTCGGTGSVATKTIASTGSKNSGTQATVTGNSGTVKCRTCGDTGWCPYCDGIGTCSNNNCFNGQAECDDCYGTGDCGYCYGMGYSIVGDTDCHYCTDGECRSCGGKGEWKCTTCNGSGECNYCDYGFCLTCGG